MDDIHTPARPEQSNLDTSHADRERSLDALHALELHAGSAAPGREPEWLTSVHDALTSFQHALRIQIDGAVAEDSLLTAVSSDAPRLLRPVHALRRRYQAISDDVATLIRQLDGNPKDDTIDATDIRQALDRLASELRYQRAREADLVYEAYAVDLGEGD